MARKFQLGKWLSNAGLMTMIRGLQLLPFQTRANFGGWLVQGLGGTFAGYRKRAEKHLSIVWPDMPAEDRKRIATQVLDNAGRTFFENFYPKDFQATDPKIEVWGEGLEDLMAAHESGRSILLVSGHFGNHEAMRLGLSRKGMAVGGIYRPMKNPYFNDFYETTLDINGKAGPLFTNGRTGIKGFRTSLKNGGVVLVLLVDLSVRTGEEMQFLGHPAMTSTAAAAFALESNALYLPYFSMRNADRNSFSVEIGKVIDPSTPTEMTREATDALEERITKDPGNWFWVHRRWKPWF